MKTRWHEVLVVNGREAEARRVASIAKRIWSDETFHEGLDQALTGEMPEPWP